MGATIREVVSQRSGKSLWQSVLRAWSDCVARIHVQRKTRALRLGDTLPLGDRRFLAVVHWKNETLLIGVTPQHINLVSTLEQRTAKQVGFEWESQRAAAR